MTCLTGLRDDLMTTQEVILTWLTDERKRQDDKWGAQRHLDDNLWTTILGEEYGEICRAILEKDWENLKEELVQTAAVCVAALEDLIQSGRLDEARLPVGS